MFQPVAIVGQACVLPGALDVRQFADNVFGRRDVITDAPEGRWGMPMADALGEGRDRAWSSAGGYVTGFESVWDPSGFGVPAAELAGIDPLTPWLLHVGRAALRSAGLDVGDPRLGRCGAIFGNLSFPTEGMARWGEQVTLSANGLAAPDADPRDRFMSGLPADLLARGLGLGSASFAIDAACASSLYAIRLACDALANGRADMMLAGAVQRADSLFLHVGFCALGAMSRLGMSRPFHRGADGLVPAEGCALIVLKRLSDAVRDGDRILGVIRGVGLSNDARARNLLAPSEEGQIRALRAAYLESGLTPADLQLVECHATGTPTGDKTEIATLSAVFGNAKLPIGSLKSMVGHLITAAGAAGLQKVLAGFERQSLPPTLHGDAPIPSLEASSFRLVHTPEPWDAKQRRACVSAFGFGGNNAHLVVEEHVPGAAVSVPVSAPRAKVAIVGLAVAAGTGDDRVAFAADLDRVTSAPKRDVVTLPLPGLRFPPKDLGLSLPQQTLLLRVALDAVAEAGVALPREKTGVYVGMGADVVVGGYGLRWRLGALTGATGAELDRLRDAVIPALRAENVVGTMPNIPANRLSVQLDIGGPGFTLSAEELSGVAALATGLDAVRSGKLDVALIGAVDLAADGRHTAALAALGVHIPAGDAAVVLLLERLDAAEAAGHTVWAVLDDVALEGAGAPPLGGAERADSRSRIPSSVEAPTATRAATDAKSGSTAEKPGAQHPGNSSAGSSQARAERRSDTVATPPALGHAHAAMGLLDVAAAAITVARGAATARTTRTSVGGGRATVALSRHGSSKIPTRAALPGPLLTFPAHEAEIRLERLEAVGRRLEAGRSGAAPGSGGEAPGSQGEAPGSVREAPGSGLRAPGSQGGSSGVSLRTAALALAPAPALPSVLARWVPVTRPTPVVSIGMYGPGASVRAPWIAPRLVGGDARQPGATSVTHVGQSSGPAASFASGGSAAHVGQSSDPAFAGRASVPATHVGQASGPAAPFASGATHVGQPSSPAASLAGPGSATPAAGPASAPHAPATHVGHAPHGGVESATRAGQTYAHAASFATSASPATHPTATHVGQTYASAAPLAGATGGSPTHVGQTPAPAAPFVGPAATHVGQTSAPTAPFAGATGAPTHEGQRAALGLGPRPRPAWATGARSPTPPSAPRASSSLRTPASGLQSSASLQPRTKRAPMSQPTDGLDPMLAALLEQQGRISDVHRAFLEQQLEVQRRFAEARSATTRMLLEAANGAPLPPPAEAPAYTATASFAPTFAPAPAPAPTVAPPPAALAFAAPPAAERGNPGMAPAPALPPTMARPPSAPTSAPAPAPKAAQAPAPVTTRPATLPGPKLSRQDLVEMSRGPISKHLGAEFVGQDQYARVVRMPEPPLLLCDRVLGIEGPATKLGKGTIWTETDVTEDAWYLHERRMPAGVMIEAGQADLLLVSWQGIDLTNNKGERMYRLLGCDLRYEGGLPTVGDTLRYDIHVDGHAKLGDIRMFFFHYDCRIGDGTRLTVREGQAGFFSAKELLDSGGVLWDAATAEIDLSGPLAPPALVCTKTSFSKDDLVAFTEGRIRDCFGPAFHYAETHTRTPRIAGGKLLFFDRVTEFAADGGPWKRGYLRAEADIRPDHWFFDGHFHNDPCMPGTLMFEGCLQALQVYLTALGHTVHRDGWRFEPRQGETFHLRCRGQVIPISKLLTYELFVMEVGVDPVPYVKAQVMCTVDGLKCFHADPLTLVMVPDWPLTRMPELLANYTEPKPCVWDYTSLLSCAWGPPSDAFGEMYKVFDGTRRVARLPGPPYHFMSRVSYTDCPIGVCKAGGTIEIEYDVPPKDWYFRENGNPTMPFAVLLEAALQPCGWLASYVGSALTSEGDLLFRNLDGTGTLHQEIRPDGGTLVTRVKITSINRSAGMIIESFEVKVTMGGQPLYDMKTVFGFFPPAAFENQVGVGSEEADRAWLASPNDFLVDLTTRPARYCGGTLRMPAEMLCMLDRVTGYWPEGGKAGLGKWRAEKDVDSTEWFFKAHFYQDPVQPGSLGIEAMIQLAQFIQIHTGVGDRFKEPRFEPIALGSELKWKYRGQVVPRNKLIQTELEITKIEGDTLYCEAHLWVDGKRIYSAWNLGMRVVEGAGGPQFPFDGGGAQGFSPLAPGNPSTEAGYPRLAPDFVGGSSSATGIRPRLSGDSRLPAATPPVPSSVVTAPAIAPRIAQVSAPPAQAVTRTFTVPVPVDHCPTYVLPALPAMTMVMLALQATGAPALRDVTVMRWLSFPDGPRDVTATVLGERVTLGGPEPFFAATACAPLPPVELPALRDAVAGPDGASLYASGELFHGPSFHVVERVVARGSNGATLILRAAPPDVLLDGITHGVPHDRLETWCADVAPGQVGYPSRIEAISLYGAPPRGSVRCEVRFLGMVSGRPRIGAHLYDGDTILASVVIQEVLLPKGRIGESAPSARRDFLLGGAGTGVSLSKLTPVPLGGLAPGIASAEPDVPALDGRSAPTSRSERALRPRDSVRDPQVEGGLSAELSALDVRGSDWLPGTVARVFGATDPATIAAKEVGGALLGAHPRDVTVAEARAWERHRPLRTVALSTNGSATVGQGPIFPDMSRVTSWWRRELGAGAWPGEDIIAALARRYLADLVVHDPVAMESLRGRPVLFLGNHENYLESVIFTCVAPALFGTRARALAKVEHQGQWLGALESLLTSWPGNEQDPFIVWFDQKDPASLPALVRGATDRSLLVHVEGTRQVTPGQPVEKISSLWVDVALERGIPVVPVAFRGGLDGQGRHDVPAAAQTHHIGAPILPEALAAMPYADRRRRIADAINALGVGAPLAPVQAPRSPGRGIRDALDGIAAGPIRELLDGRTPPGEWWARLAGLVG